MIASWERSACGVPASAASIARLPPTSGPVTVPVGPATCCTGARRALPCRSSARTRSRARAVTRSPRAVITGAWMPSSPRGRRPGELLGQSLLAEQGGEEGGGVREAEQRPVRHRRRIARQPDQVLEQVHRTEAAPGEPDRVQIRGGHRPLEVGPPLCHRAGGVPEDGQDVVADDRFVAPARAGPSRPPSRRCRLDDSRGRDDRDARTLGQHRDREGQRCRSSIGRLLRDRRRSECFAGER